MKRYIRASKDAYIREWAEEGWETGHPLDLHDFSEFQKIGKEDGYDLTEEDFNKYFEYFDDIRSEEYS